MSKKNPKVKFVGSKPENNLLHAKIPNNTTTQIMGEKVNLNHRASALVETNVEVEVETGYKLCFKLVSTLSDRGIVATNAPGAFKEGKIYANLLNVGREIVEVKTGDPLMHIWIEQDLQFDWSEK